MDIALNDKHDIFVDKSDLVLTTGETFLTQSLKIRLQFILNEWFLDTLIGLPYPTIIFERGTDISTIYRLYQEEIANTTGVKEVISLTLTPKNDTRSLTIDFTIKQDNDTVVSEQILIEV